jgi:hypothetical protein
VRLCLLTTKRPDRNKPDGPLKEMNVA